MFCLCTEPSVSRDHDDVTNSEQQPIYSSVNDADDVHQHPQHSHRESLSSSALSVAAEYSNLSKYVHETPI